MRREESFLKRWSRLKKAAEELAKTQPAGTAAPTPVPELPPIESLDINSDFSGFLHPDVDPALRTQALKKLFRDPHFNVMDGLDVYVEDYSVSEPIPSAMLQQLLQAQTTPRDEAPEETPQIAQAEGETTPELAPIEAKPSPEVEGDSESRTEAHMQPKDQT